MYGEEAVWAERQPVRPVSPAAKTERAAVICSGRGSAWPDK